MSDKVAVCLGNTLDFPVTGRIVPGSSDGFLTKLAFGCAVSLRPLAPQSHTRLITCRAHSLLRSALQMRRLMIRTNERNMDPKFSSMTEFD